MSTRHGHEYRYSQPRDSKHRTSGRRRETTERPRPSYRTFEQSFSVSQQYKGREPRSSDSDLQYDDNPAQDEFEQYDSEAEYIGRRLHSQGDHITPYASRECRRNVRFSNNAHLQREECPSNASPPTRVPFVSFNCEELESYRGQPQGRKSSLRKSIQQEQPQRLKSIESQGLETWGFGGHDEGTMSPEEPRALSIRHAHYSTEEESSSDIDIAPSYHPDQHRQPKPPVHHRQPKPKHSYRIVGEFPSSDMDEQPQLHEENDSASDLASIRYDSSTDHIRAPSSTTPSSFSSPSPSTQHHATNSPESSSSSSRSDIPPSRPFYPRSSFSAPVPRSRGPRPAPAPIPHRQTTHSSFSTPHLPRRHTYASVPSRSAGAGAPHLHAPRQRYTGTAYRSYGDDIGSDDDEDDDGIHSGSDYAALRSDEEQDVVSGGESDVQDCIESEDEQCIGSGYEEMPRTTRPRAWR
ncbi:hypothetical protein ACN47E_004722 [Coniothyrium glycines]